MRKGDKLWFIKSLLEYPRGPQTYQGRKLKRRDLEVSRDAIYLWICVVRSCVESESLRTDGRLFHIMKNMESVDLFDLLDGLSSLDSFWLETTYVVENRTETSLKDVIPMNSATGVLREVIGLLHTHWNTWFSERSVTGWAKCHQCFCYLSRLNLEDKELAKVAYTKWCEVEALDLSDADPSEIELRVFDAWFPLENAGIIFSYMNPHHSSGSTYEKVSAPGEKAMLNGLDDRLDDFLWFTGWHDVVQTTMMQSLYPRVAPEELAVNTVPANARLEMDVLTQHVCRPSVNRNIPAHRVHFVPKNWKTHRTVSCEPIAYMYWQQALGSALQRYLKARHARSLSNMYCVNTEQRNRDLAKLGSIDGRLATIDLSSASDTVAWRYVAQLTQGTALQQVLELTRTSYAEVDETTVFGRRDNGGTEYGVSLYSVQKYAPMGSALCFPIESIVFATVLRAVFLEWRSSHSSRRGYAEYCGIYGDDIVCPIEIAIPLMERLESIGFLVNRDKSFYNSPLDGHRDFFRESCGGEYLNGTDVTPKRISRKFCGLYWDEVSITNPGAASRVAQLISLANDLYDLRTARELVLYSLVTVGRVSVLFDEDGTRGVRSSSPTNYHLRRRWNSDLQEWEVLAVTVSTLPKWVYRLSTDRWRREGVFDDFVYSSPYESCPGEVRLFEYLRQASMSQRKRLLFPEDEASERMDPYSTESVARLSWVTAPLQYRADVGAAQEEANQYAE